MKYLIFVGLASIEYVLITLLTSKITKIKDYMSINYDVFNFAPIGERKCGLNILIKMIAPIIYTIICSGIFYKVNLNYFVQDIYIVQILYFVLRWIIIIFIYDRKDLNDWKSEILVFIFSTAIMLLIYYSFIIQTTDIFISTEELKNAVWIGIITFAFLVIRDYIYNYVKVDTINSEKRKTKYILKKYVHFKTKYGFIFEKEEKELQRIIYAIMIYENYNRPFVIRMLEYIKFLFKGEATLGVMQFKTSKIITDEQSVKSGYNKIKEKYKQYKTKTETENDLLMKIVLDYNCSVQYFEEVKYIIDIIYNI